MTTAIGDHSIDLLVSNPPYVPIRERDGLQREVRDYEPHTALFAGESGFDVYDMVGNLHEWTAAKTGTFRGGYYLDTHKNGDGCSYRTVAHEFTYHDYSTGFRCCASPVAP